MGRPRIAFVKSMLEDARAGMRRSDIAKKYKVSLRTVDKYCKSVFVRRKRGIGRVAWFFKRFLGR